MALIGETASRGRVAPQLASDRRGRSCQLLATEQLGTLSGCWTVRWNFPRIRAVDLAPVRTRERSRKGQHVVHGVVHAPGQLEQFLPELVGHAARAGYGRGEFRRVILSGGTSWHRLRTLRQIVR